MKRLIPIILALIIATVPLTVYGQSCSVTPSKTIWVVYSDKLNITGRVSYAGGQLVVLYNLAGKPVGYQKMPNTGKAADFSIPTPTLKKDSVSFFYVKALKGKNVSASSARAIMISYESNMPYTIVYNPNGGKGTMQPQKASRNKIVVLSKNKFKRDGYEFVGWAYASGNPNTSSKDVTKFKNVNMKKFQLGTVGKAKVPTATDFKKNKTQKLTDGCKVKNLAPANGKIVLYAVWKGKGPQAAVDWAKYIARDNNFAYGTGNVAHQNGCYYCGTNVENKGKKYRKTYCCNPFIKAAYVHGANIRGSCSRIDPSIPFGAMSTVSWTCYNSAPGHKGKFKKVGKSNLRAGDILVSSGHVWMYVGNGQIVEAGQENWGKNSISVNSTVSLGLANFVMRYYPN